MTLDILAISPHPDDAEIFCGGTLFASSKKGYKVGVLDLTQGEMGSRGDIKVREKEAKKASKVLGLCYRENLALPDSYLDSTNREQINSLVKLIRKLKPKIILSPYFEERHPDHMEASKLADKAIFFSGLRKYVPESGPTHTPKQILYYQMRFSFRPSLVVDVSKGYEKKLKSIYCHQSQVGKSNKDKIKTLVGSPLAISSITARDEYYGAMIGIKYGEPFFMKNCISIADPVAHFSSYPDLGALIFP